MNEDKISETDFDYCLKITRTDNGYLLEGLLRDTGIPSKRVIEDDEKDELKSHEILLWEVMEYFSFGGSKHDKERLKIIRHKNE